MSFGTVILLNCRVLKKNFNHCASTVTWKWHVWSWTLCSTNPGVSVLESEFIHSSGLIQQHSFLHHQCSWYNACFISV